MSNQSNNFCTPPELIQPIKEFWGGKIDLDPCSNRNSLVKAETETETEWALPTDSLRQPWAIKQPVTTVFVNPPYGPYWLSSDGRTCLSPKEYGAHFESPAPLGNGNVSSVGCL